MHLKIQKFNPLTDAAPYYVEGDVTIDEKRTALDALYLFHTQVQAVNFDYSCGGRLCGRCAVMLDGKPALLCMAVLTEGSHTIEPLAGFPVIHDLVVDKTSFNNVMSNVAQRVMIEPVTKDTMAPKDFVYNADEQFLMLQSEYCCRCGMCNAICPGMKAYPDEYVGPAQMYQIGFRHLDYYDKSDRIAEAVSKGMYRCIMCGQCTDVCSLQIDHISMWNVLRDAAATEGIVPSYAQK
jgi:succinate dehydrogenase/fumarate reductase iron-sulfur protein